MATDTVVKKTRLSLTEKQADGFKWFKQKADELKGGAFSSFSSSGKISEKKRKQVNYDLFNNIVDMKDFEYVCQPFGEEVGTLPASFSNKDITSTRIKKVLGMESSKPFSWRVVAINEEATTRKEEEEFGLIKDYVISNIMTPIRQEIEIKYQQKLKGGNLSQEEMKSIQEQIAQELEARTPDKVRKYMQRKHQDPAEAMAQQLLRYLVQKKDIKRKFSKIWKHSLLAGEGPCWVGIINGEPDAIPVNAKNFDYDRSPDLDFIEDGEWAVAQYRMSPSQVVSIYGSEMTDKEIDEIMEGNYMGASIHESDWSFEETSDLSNTITVTHCTWKDLRKMGFLSYLDEETGTIQETMVDEAYKFNPDNGDIEIEWEWLSESYETTIIGSDIYVFMRPIEGQFKNMDDIYNCKLPYYGVSYDNLNSETTSLMDRMKVWQYYYNIVMYRLELLMASDKGKLMLMNLNAIPKSSGIDLKTWMHYFEALKIGFVDPNEEGNRGLPDVTQMAKEIDMSLVSDIQKYVELAKYIEDMCGRSVGIPEEMIGQIEPKQAVANTRQNVAHNTHILEPYFALHDHVKRNILQALLDQAKIAYRDHKEKLSYVLDDLSIEMFELDGQLLDESTLGIFIANSSSAHEAKEFVKTMAHAAMQNDTINLSDVVKVIRTEGIQEAEEQLVLSEEAKRKQVEQAQINAIKEQGKNDEKERDFKREEMKFKRETELMIEDKKTQRDLAKQAMLSVGFNEDKDMDNDGELDVLEIYKKQKEVDIKARKQDLDEKKFDHQKKVDREKIALEKKKANNQNKAK